jgi:hypothetical protein
LKGAYGKKRHLPVHRHHPGMQGGFGKVRG